MQFLAGWARRISWKETAEVFHTSWDQVCDAVEYVVGWGLEHRTLESIRAIGVDEIQYAKASRQLRRAAAKRIHTPVGRKAAEGREESGKDSRLR
jgi:hypothetical protein